LQSLANYNAIDIDHAEGAESEIFGLVWYTII